MNRKLKNKWLELQAADGSCLTKGTLAACQNGKVCSCSAGFLLRAAGYTPRFLLKEDITPYKWTTPNGDDAYGLGEEVSRLLSGTGMSYRDLFQENDAQDSTPEHMLAVINRLPVEPDTAGEVA